MIASARLYEWAPTLLTAWHRLLEDVAARAKVALDFAPGGVSLDELWARDDLGCVFMCGYPYALRAERADRAGGTANDRPALLAAPVPSPPRFGDRPAYVSDFIVRAEAPFETLEDTFGGRIAYSTQHSQSGYNAARHHLLAYRTPARPALFAEVKGPYVRQRAVIQAVLDGEADVAAIDGYAHDLLRRHDPALAARLRVVGTTAPSPSPPLVASPRMSAPERERLTEALLDAHRTPSLQPVLDDLLLRRFERVRDQDFATLLEQQRAAEAAGYPKLA